MKIINLVSPEKGNIQYKISKFPDGQQDITLDYSPIIPENSSTLVENIMIKSRFNSFRDLELIIATTAALRRLGVKEIHLYIPYLLGARSDRQFVNGGNSYLVDVIAPILNAQNFESVQVMDAHSDIAAACIKNLKPISLDNFYKEYFRDKSNFLLVSPDGGSLKKLFKVADLIGYTDEIVVCSKYRDTEGKLSRTFVPLNISNFAKDLIIVDDICDGGRTFINIIREVQQLWPTREAKNHLVVTHGIFSAGFGDLAKYFGSVYSTDSVANFDNSLLKQFNVY